MHRTLKVARREYLATVRTKGFIIGLVLAPVLMAGSLLVMVLMKGRIDTEDKTIAVVDRSGVVAPWLVRAAEERNAREASEAARGRRRLPAYTIEIVRPDEAAAEAQRLRLSQRIRRDSLHAFLEVGAGVLHPGRDTAASRMSYHGQNSALDEARQWIGEAANQTLRWLRLAEAGIDTARVPDLFTYVRAEPLGLFSVDEATGRVTDAPRRSEAEALFPPIAMFFLMFIMLMMGAMPQLNATMEEKSQRIAEVVLGSVRPFEFMLGKVLGGVAVALTASAVYIAAGLYTLTVLGLTGVMPLPVVAWFVVYMALAVAMFGAQYAALGAACNDAAEAQSVAFVGILPMMIPSFVLLPIVMAPNGAFATGLSLFPPFTPMVMLMRLATPGGVPGWQPWAGLLGVVLTTLLVVWVGGRVFRVAILMQGTPPKLRNFLRWAVKG